MTTEGQLVSDTVELQKSVFISYASEDKEEVARPLATELERLERQFRGRNDVKKTSHRLGVA